MSRGADHVWSRRKRVLAWVHFSVQIAVLLVFLVMANLLASKFPARFDLTSRRTYALSAMAEDLLRNLKYDVEIWVNPETYAATDDKALPTAFVTTKELLEEFRRRTDHVKVYEYSGQNTPRYDVFQKHFSAITPATLFILATLDGGRVNQKQIDIMDLFVGNAQTGELSVYKGEPVLVQSGDVVSMETASLVVTARVVDMAYGGGALPPNSFFERLTIELAAFTKKAAA